MNRREFNKQETIRLIRDTFLEQYVAQGVERLSVTGLCRACGISKSTFYLYFDDKFAVLESIEQELLSSLREIGRDLTDVDMTEIEAGQPVEKALATLRFIRNNADKFRALMGARGDPRFVYLWEKDIRFSFLDRFRAEQRNERSANEACILFSSALVGYYTHILFEEPQMSEREMAIILGNLLRYTLYHFDAS